MPLRRLLRAVRATGLGTAAAITIHPALTDRPATASPRDSTAVWEFAVFAQTDSRGELRPCHCPGLESGGLGLRATVFKKARAMQIPALIVDGGDFVAGPEDTLRAARAALFVAGMERLPYDAVAVGERELLLGMEFLTDAAARLPLVCANLEGGEDLGVPRARRVELDGKIIGVTAYLDPGVLPPHSTWRLTDPEESLSAILASWAGTVDAVVVLAHAATRSAEETIAQLSGVHVAVRGHAPEDGPDAMRVGPVPLLLPSSLGRNVIHAALSFSAEGDLRTQRIRSWEIKQVEKGDPRLDALVEEFEAVHGLEP